MTEKFHDTSLENYFYSEQMERYVVQFMAIFTGLKVRFGKNDYNSQTDLVRVPIRYGSSDRVVDHILSENTQNKPVRVPMMSAHITGIFLTPGRAKGVGQVARNVNLPAGGALPDDLINTVKPTPIPYQLNMELAIYTSNYSQHLQIMEQILVLFEPTLQLQTSDDSKDWTRLTTVELMDIDFQQNYPVGTQQRIMVSTLQFKIPIWLTQPVNLKKNIVQNIKLRLDVINAVDDVNEAVCDINNNTGIDENLINIDDLDIPPN